MAAMQEYRKSRAI